MELEEIGSSKDICYEKAIDTQISQSILKTKL